MLRNPPRATVLVVDRDEDTRIVCRPLFEAAGFEVLEADDGVTGLSMARERAPDVVITELTLTGLDGFALIRELKERLRDTFVVVLTARRIPADREAAGAAGCSMFLEKPIPPQVLVREVSAVLERRLPSA